MSPWWFLGGCVLGALITQAAIWAARRGVGG